MSQAMLERPPVRRPSRLVEDHLPMVQRIAARRSSQRRDGLAEYGDLYAEGVIGLMGAAERFDESRGVPFEAWASIRVAGAIVNHLRKLEWGGETRARSGRDVPKVVSLEHRDSTHERIGGRHRAVDDRRRRFESQDELEGIGFYELPLRERCVLTLLYVLEYSDVEAGRMLGMSASRIEQIELTALAALRSSAEGLR